jgi:hypothetical protein
MFFRLFAPRQELWIALDILNDTGATLTESGSRRASSERTVVPGDAERIEIAITQASLGDGDQAALFIPSRESDKYETVTPALRKHTTDLVQQLWLTGGTQQCAVAGTQGPQGTTRLPSLHALLERRARGLLEIPRLPRAIRLRHRSKSKSACIATLEKKDNRERECDGVCCFERPRKNPTTLAGSKAAVADMTFGYIHQHTTSGGYFTRGGYAEHLQRFVLENEQKRSSCKFQS